MKRRILISILIGLLTLAVILPLRYGWLSQAEAIGAVVGAIATITISRLLVVE